MGPFLVVLHDELKVTLWDTAAALSVLSCLLLFLNGFVLHFGIIIYNSESWVKFTTQGRGCRCGHGPASLKSAKQVGQKSHVVVRLYLFYRLTILFRYYKYQQPSLQVA
jgi:hypothetical protein